MSRESADAPLHHEGPRHHVLGQAVGRAYPCGSGRHQLRRSLQSLHFKAREIVSSGVSMSRSCCSAKPRNITYGARANAIKGVAPNLLRAREPKQKSSRHRVSALFSWGFSIRPVTN